MIMKFGKLFFIGFVLFALAGCTMPLTMPPPSQLEVKGVQQHPYTAGLLIPKELREYVYVKQTSPVDKMSYPLGEQTEAYFQKNLPLVFKTVVPVNSQNPSEDVKIVIQPSIVKFESVIPLPAYNPYTARIVYRVDVYNKKGEKIFTQTTTGDAQTSKGMVSGFSARGLCAEAAQKAMEDAIRQILEGLSEADELKKI
jgi:hypothetical protein